MATKKTGSLKGTDVVLITSVNLAADVGASVLPVANGGTGTGTWTDGQIAIGNTTGNTLVKTTLTGTSNQVVVTNGAGAITLSLPQSIATTSSPTFAALTVNGKINGVTNGTATGEVLTFDAIGVSVQAYSASTTLLGNTVTGTGSIVLATSPTLVTPVLGVASATSLTATSTTEQLRLRYDSSNYLSTTVSSAGLATLATTGTNASITLTPSGTGNVIMSKIPRFNGTNSTGAGSSLLGANSPATTLTAPYTWISVITSDGSTAYIPCWK